jgi:hypothetical protein
MAQSRKRRKERRRAATAPSAPAAAPSPDRAARTEAKNEAARAALEPLAPGERPTAVTVGAVVAALFALANVVAVLVGWDQGVDEDDRARAVAYTILATGVLLVLAWGMWKAKYWAVLGMQTLLALTLVACSLALVTASSAGGALLLVAMIAAAGALFWFMVKAMARIQMPERPTRAR